MFNQVLWFLCGGGDIASSRLHGYTVHHELQRQGYDSRIVYAPANGFQQTIDWRAKRAISGLLGSTVSVVQKLKGPGTERLIEWLRRCGSHVVYVDCDVNDGDCSWQGANRIFVPSREMANYFARKNAASRPTIIKEPYDFALSRPSNVNRAESNIRGHRLVVGWFGNAENWEAYAPWKTVIEHRWATKFELLTCSNHPEADVPWSLENLASLLQRVEVCLLPYGSGEKYLVKSPNRLVQAAAAGVPSIVGPQPSYIEMKANGLTCLVASTLDELEQSLEVMLNPSERSSIATTAWDYATSGHSASATAEQWVDLLALQKPRRSDRPWNSLKSALVNSVTPRRKASRYR